MVLPVTANLYGHWDASVIGQSDGSDVTSWADQSGNGRHFVQHASDSVPDFETNMLNGLPGVEFAGSERLELLSISLAAPRTIFLVATNPTNTGAIKTVVIGAATLFAKWSQNSRWIWGHNSGSFLEFTDAAFVAANTIWTFVHKATGAFVRADQVQKVSGNITANTETSLSLSATSDSGAPMVLYEVIIYNAELSSGDIDLVEDYLYTKWFTVSFTGTGASTLAGVTSAGSGTYTPSAITGTGSSTLAGVSSAGSGTYTPQAITGTGSSTLSGVTSSGTGSYTPQGVTGTGSVNLDGVTSAGSGTSTVPQYTGTGTTTLGDVTSTGTGQYGSTTGTGTSVLDGVTSTGSGTYTPQPITGSGSPVLQGVTSTGSGVFASSAQVENVLCRIEAASATCTIVAARAVCRIET